MKRAFALIAGTLFVMAVFTLTAPSEAKAQGGASFSVAVGNQGYYGYPSPYYNYYPPVVVNPSYYYSVPPNYSYYNTYYPPVYKTHPRSLYSAPYNYRPLRAYPW